MALLSNLPTFTHISWNGLIVTHKKELYNVKNNHTNMQFVYWEAANPYELVTSRTRLKETATRFLLFTNEKGIAYEKPQTDISLSWDGNNEDSIRSYVNGIYETVEGYGDKFVTIEADIEGLKTTVGDIIEGGVGDGDHTAIIERISQIEQKADSIDLSVKEVTKQFTDNKEINELRENLNKSIIDVNSALGIFKGEMSSYYKDNKINSEEKIKIETHISILEEKVSEVLKHISTVISIVQEQGQTTQVNALNSAKTKFTNAINNLKTYISTAISDGTIVPTEITGIIDLFSKCSVAINELKNTCDEVIYLGAGGSIAEELSRIGIKSDEIVIKVSESFETINNSISLEKSQFQGNVTDFKNAIGDLTKVLNDVSKDNNVSVEEKTIINNRIQEAEKEKVDIDTKYSELYSNKNLSESEKKQLKEKYDTFNNSFTELKNKINTSIQDSIISSVEKTQIDTLINVLLSNLNELHSTVTKCIDNIEKNLQSAEIQAAKDALQNEINDLENSVIDLDDYMNTIFKDKIISHNERLILEEKIKDMEKEKLDIDKKYEDLYNNPDLI